jgi:hypothetical protein
MKITKSQLRELIKEELSNNEIIDIMVAKLNSLGFKEQPSGNDGEVFVKDFGDSCIALAFGPTYDSRGGNIWWWASWHVPYKKGVVSKVLSQLFGKPKFNWKMANTLMGKSFEGNHLDLGDGLFRLDKAGAENEITKRAKMAIQKAKSEGLI